MLNNNSVCVLLLKLGLNNGTMNKFLAFDVLDVSHRIPQKNRNAVYCLQISALVPKIFKFEKDGKYADEMTDDVIHSTQYYIKYVKYLYT